MIVKNSRVKKNEKGFFSGRGFVLSADFRFKHDCEVFQAVLKKVENPLSFTQLRAWHNVDRPQHQTR